MKIVVKKENGDIDIINPNMNIYGAGGKSLEDCKGLLPYKNGERECIGWYMTDEIIDKSDLETREQLYWEDNAETGKTEIKKDFGWKKKLIPVPHIRLKYKKRLMRKMGIELAKANPDHTEIARMNLEIMRVMEKTEKEWYEIALKNIEEDGHDKPEIVEKLKKKIEELG